MSPSFTFTTARALGASRILVASARADLPPHSPFTRLLDVDVRRDPICMAHDVELWATDVIGAVDVKGKPASEPVALGALSEDGELSWTEGVHTAVESIADAGLHRASSKRYGYLNSMCRVGAQLYACGGRGQVYRRRAPDEWEHLDDGLLQKNREPDRLSLQTIDGFADDDLYAAGDISLDDGVEGRIYHWNGATWSAAAVPRVGGLNALYLEDRQHIWAAGMDGDLLLGNHHDGFTSVIAPQAAHLFHDVTRYQGTLYLASNNGLFRYDEEKRRVVRVRTTLKQEIKYASYIDHADGVFWCVGPHELVQFDGARWERVDVAG